MRAFIAIVLVLGCLVAAFVLLAQPRRGTPAVAHAEPATSTASEPGVLRAAQPAETRSERVIETETPAVAEPTETAPLATIAGIVRVNGRIPDEAITLRLRGDATTPHEQDAIVDGEGRFTFTDLPARFRGQIDAPRRYRISVPAGARSVAVESGQEDLVIELLRRPSLIGRLVSPSYAPVEPLRVGARITYGDGGGTSFSADLEPGGRFFVPVSETRVLTHVSIEAQADAGLQGWFEFAQEEIPLNLDLGELVLTPGLRVRLVVLDPERRPVAGARVIAPKVQGSQQFTDSEGQATLEGLPHDAQLQVLARGFDPLMMPAPVSEEFVELVLERANRLNILVLGTAGEPEPGVHVRITSAEHAFLLSDSGPDPLLVPQVAQDGPTVGWHRDEGFYVMFLTDERGLVELQSIKPLLPLTLRVEDATGSALHEEPIAPLRAQEVRELTIRLSSEPRELAGRVEDPEGQPLEGAKVVLFGGDHAVEHRTGADGLFSFTGIRAAQVDLQVARRGYVTTRLPDLPVAGASALRIVLDPGRDVLVSVVDPRGERVGAGILAARLDDFNWYANRGEDGQHHFYDLPMRELEVRLHLAGTQYLQSLAAYAEELEIRVPQLGRLEVSCKLAPDLPEQRLGLLLRSVDDAKVEQFLILQATRTDPMLFEAVLPGTHELCFATWRKEGTTNVFVPQSPPVQVKVEPGETQRVNL